MTDKEYLVWIDGASKGNPGISSAAAIIKDPDGTVLADRGLCLGEATNNEAEYQALILALTEALKINIRRLKVHSDSQLLIKQVTGEFRVKSPNILPLIKEAMRLRAKFSEVKFVHIPRDENKEADLLANQTLKPSFKAKTSNRASITQKFELSEDDRNLTHVSRNLALEIHKMTLMLPEFEINEEGEAIRRASKSVSPMLVQSFGRADYPEELLKYLIFAHSGVLETQEHLRILIESGSLKVKSDTITSIKKGYFDLQKKIEAIIKRANPVHKF